MMSPGRPAALASLFREDASLSESIQWLQSVYLKRLEGDEQASELEKLVLRILADGLLPEGMTVEKVDSTGLWVTTPEGRSVALTELSDGYRTVTGLVLDPLWDAAGTRVFGGGIDDEQWLGSQSKVIGMYEKTRTTTTTSGGNRSRSQGTQQEARASVAELANLPEWRAVVRTSNGVTVIVETVPVFRGPAFAEVMRAADTIGVNA